MNQGVYEALSGAARAEGGGATVPEAEWRGLRQHPHRVRGACRPAKLEDFHFHDPRHTATSHLLMRGATLPDVKAVLGHSDVKMTMRYVHLSPEHLRGAWGASTG